MWTVPLNTHSMVIACAPACALIAVALANRVELTGVAPSTRVTLWPSLVCASGVCLATAATLSPTHAIGVLILLSFLVFLAAFDARFLAVPVLPVLVLIAAGLCLAVLEGALALALRAGAALAGWSVFTVLDGAHRVLRGQSGLGAGDGLVAALIGAWLSFEGLAWSVALGAGLTVVWALARKHPGEQPLPLVPGLTAGVVLVLALQPVLRWDQ